MAFSPNNTNGQKTAANSAPVVIASDQLPTATSLPDNHAVPTTTEVGAITQMVGGIGTLEKARSVTSVMNNLSTGIAASGMVAQLDDTSTTTITEDQFGVVRMSSRRALLVEGVSGGTAVPVSLATNTPTIAAGSAVIGKVGIDQTTPGTTNLVALAANQTVNAALINGVAPLMGNGVTGTGSLRVTLASDTTANSNPFLFRHAASTTSSGLLLAKINAAASTNATLILTGTRAVYGWTLTNTTAVNQVVRIYGKATAPTVGTDSPIFIIVLPPNGGAVMPPGVVNIPVTLGLGYAITTGLTDLDATATTANSVVGTIYYI